MADKIYIADKRYYKEINEAFGAGRIILPSVSCAGLAEPVSCHPDMALYPAGRGIVVCAPQVYEDYAQILSPFGVRLVQGKTVLTGDYPGDIAYNVLNANLYALALWEKTDEQIRAALACGGTRPIRVAQGYARCSSVSFGNALITADPSIRAAAQQVGLAVLAISSGGVLLPGYSYGFIGGASGLLDDRTVAFFGSLDMHPDGEAMKAFIQKHGFSVLDIPNRPLFDVGTILSIEL